MANVRGLYGAVGNALLVIKSLFQGIEISQQYQFGTTPERMLKFCFLRRSKRY